MARFKSAKGAAKRAARKEVEVLGDNRKLIDAATAAKLSGSVWKAEVEGDTIAGEILKLGQSKGKFGKQTTMLIDSGKDGVRTVYANESMQRGIDECKAEVGDRIAVQYRGTVPTGRGRPFKLYAVVKAAK
jgi:hypothetical protein